MALGVEEKQGMSSAVVRCTGCAGASRVGRESLGALVECPRCLVAFVAIEEIAVIRTGPRTPAVPVAPRPDRPRRPRPPAPAAPPEPPPTELPPGTPDPVHDPHHAAANVLPLSVMIGLALLPFGIPLLWWAAPVLTGREAVLSVAVPVALAIAAAALCLGIVYTIDWTGTTRLKGVMMLVGLSYLTGAGLYFLNRDMGERLQSWFGAPEVWPEISPDGSGCRVRMPARPVRPPEQENLLPGVELQTVKVEHQVEFGGPKYVYHFGFTDQVRPGVPGDDAWFNARRDELKNKWNGFAGEVIPKLTAVPNATCRQWEFQFPNSTRLVRVIVVRGRVYYLSVEGPALAPDSKLATDFFDSFRVN